MSMECPTLKERHNPVPMTKVRGNGFNRETLFVVEQFDYDRLMTDALEMEELLLKAVPFMKRSADHPASNGEEYELLGRMEKALNRTL